jgi:hypothetical protein
VQLSQTPARTTQTHYFLWCVNDDQTEDMLA